MTELYFLLCQDSGLAADSNTRLLCSVDIGYECALSRRLKRAETLDQRDAVIARIEKLEAEFKEQTRNVDYSLF